MKSVYVVGKGLIVAGNKITIDGKEHVSVENSENIVVTDDCIKIGNKTVVFKGRSIKVEIHGNVNKIVTENADVSIHGNAGDVETVSGDALAGTAHLEVHIAVEILHALNVQHGHPAVALGDHPR